jgi:hypothetical protein
MGLKFSKIAIKNFGGKCGWEMWYLLNCDGVCGGDVIFIKL